MILTESLSRFNEKKLALIAKARKRYGYIKPCIRRKTLMNSFDIYDGSLYLWFNTADGSTHIVKEPVCAPAKEYA